MEIADVLRSLFLLKYTKTSELWGKENARTMQIPLGGRDLHQPGQTSGTSGLHHRVLFCLLNDSKNHDCTSALCPQPHRTPAYRWIAHSPLQFPPGQSARGGKLILRIEDTDHERSESHYAEEQREALHVGRECIGTRGPIYRASAPSFYEQLCQPIDPRGQGLLLLLYGERNWQEMKEKAIKENRPAPLRRTLPQLPPLRSPADGWPSGERPAVRFKTPHESLYLTRPGARASGLSRKYGGRFCHHALQMAAPCITFVVWWTTG